jgi:hypothetical protein
MPTRSRSIPVSLTLLVLLAAVPATRLSGQLIQIKTLPVADGEQWRFLPSANQGIGGVSIALRDSLLDPFENPADGARLSVKSRGFLFGSPTFYAVSKNAGGGQTFPMGGITRMGSTFGGVVLALQQIDDAGSRDQVPSPGGFFVTSDGVTIAQTATPTSSGPRQNRFAFATLGHVFEQAGLSVGASAQWSGLRHMDGVDLLYVGSRNIDQHGSATDVRVGALKMWPGDRALEATVLRNYYGMTHDVTWTDTFWDPNTRSTVFRDRLQHNLDETKVWGMHLRYTQPIADAGWRIGTVVTTNLMSHPKLPEYQIAQVATIPWDPGRSAAYDLGVGIGKAAGLTRFGFDAIYEPIKTHTWGESPDSIVTPFGTRPAGAKTTENWFRFSNAIVRSGVAREIPMDSLRISLHAVRLEAGLALRSISYKFNQTDHVSRLDRGQNESWMEWTRTWGLGIRFTDLEFRYVGRTTTGAGRPGIVGDNIRTVPPALASAGDVNFLAPPNGPTTLTPVAVTTHQLSVSLPFR